MPTALCRHDTVARCILISALNALPAVRVCRYRVDDELANITERSGEAWAISFDIEYSPQGLRAIEFLERFVNTIDPPLPHGSKVWLAVCLPDMDHQVAWAMREPDARGTLIGQGAGPEMVAERIAAMYAAYDETLGEYNSAPCKSRRDGCGVGIHQARFCG